MEEMLEEPVSIKIMALYCEGQTEAERDAGFPCLEFRSLIPRTEFSDETTDVLYDH